MAESKKKFTIGVLVGGIMDEFTHQICKGALREAKAADVDVIVFPGKYWERDLSDNRELRYEYQYNTIFSYAKQVDALIIAAGSIGCYTTKEGMETLLKKFEDIPSVLIASKIEGYTSVVFDNYLGIKEGLEYLIEKRNCKKFGMVGGSLENMDAYERKQAFTGVLSEHGIEFTENMYVEGDFSKRGKAVCKKLLDDNPDIEAIFCVNDDTALGLYEELKRRGLQAGRDIFVLGYDDSLAAAKAIPSLSSVRADSAKLGAEALRMAVRMVHGENVKSQVVPTQFVMRDSFNREETQTAIHFRYAKDYINGFEEIFYRYCHEETKDEMDRLRTAYRQMLEVLDKNAEISFADSTGYMEIMLCVDEFLNLGGVEYADADNLMLILEEVYGTLRKKQTERNGRTELRNVFFNIYRKIVRSMNGLMISMKETEDRENYEMKLFVQEILSFEKGKDQSYSVLLEKLDWLHIKNAQIYLLPQPVLHLYKEDFELPEEFYLKAVLENGVVQAVSVSNQKKSLEEVFAYDLKLRKNRVVLPLFFNEIIYGILFCDMTDSLFVNGEFLVNQMSSAVKMISLLEANEKIQSMLEENVSVLKEHNIELDTISKSDVLTGILNRRGFYDVAEEKVQSCRQMGKSVLAVYVDMNNLKIINDRYGHEEGDFSLKLIGRFLKESVEGNGVAGRIGGDEYAFVMEYDGNDDGAAVLSTLYEKFENYNLESEKPYNITISAGACIIHAESELGLHEALLKADEKLYEVKQHRKKDVAKK
ncbi:MAG: GGDEF domain-containing protein [Lachnospiraceae bacterium]|nr:GGDEF domain-containing protein [Lachnospiraceae bacterium]